MWDLRQLNQIWDTHLGKEVKINILNVCTASQNNSDWIQNAKKGFYHIVKISNIELFSITHCKSIALNLLFFFVIALCFSFYSYHLKEYAKMRAATL